MFNHIRTQLMVGTLLASATAIASPAFAQDAPPAPASAQDPARGAQATPNEVQNPGPGGTVQSNDAQGRPAEQEPIRGASSAATGDVVVTGTRVARPNATSPSPITTVGQEEIREFGATRIEDLTNSLPQVFAGQSSGVSNGADGTATIDLRGLGPSRTLVLIDGRRLQPGGIGGGAGADLNFIPSALVSSVDLLTGGASTTYGADAVAGVVNFKMNRNFRGVRLDATYGFYDHNNANAIESVVNQRFTAPNGHTALGGRYDATLVIGAGTSDDRGSVVAYASYRNDKSITEDNYDYSDCTLNPDANLVGFACGGSGTPANARFGGFTTANRIAAGLPAASSYTLDPTTRQLRPFVTSDQFNFAPANYFQRPDERYQGGVFASYEVSNAFQPYVDAMFSDYSTDAQIAPSGVFYGTRTVNCDNPLLLANAQIATAICGANVGTTANASFLLGKRNVEGGARDFQIQFTQYRLVGGVKGEINDAIGYDAYYQIGQIREQDVYRNDVSNTLINNALNVRNVGGVATCVVGATTAPVTGCVPYNIFTAGGITPAAAAYINIPLVLTGTSREEIVNGTVTVDAGKYGIKSPFASDGIRLALGVENRIERLNTQPDQAFINNEGAGQGGPTLPINGRYSVRDLYAEAGVPLVTDKPFFQDLSVQLGYRNSRYNVTGATNQNSTDTYKIAGNWSPVRAIGLRASYNRAVRSPNVGELFSANQTGLFAGNDPCAGASTNVANPTAGTVNGNTFAQCARTGVTAAEFGNILANTANQYNQTTGGNVNLAPEKGDTYTAGVVLKPRVLGGQLVLSADGFLIRLQNAVGAVGAQVALNQCLTTGDPTFCSLIVRGPATAGGAAGTLFLTQSGNPIGYVNNFTINTGSVRTRGIDVNGDYRANLGSLRLRAQFIGTYLDKYQAQPFSGGFIYDCAGRYGTTCGAPNPKYRFNTNVKVATQSDFGLTVRWRYLGPTQLDSASNDPNLASPGTFPAVDSHIKPYSYFDLLFSLPINQKAVFRIGANNVFDKDPPLVSQASIPATVGNGNTFPGTYDALGRYIFVNLTADF
ncbi:TonB-dependent receptor domain-containing protein [uncultured Sphingomonas sp.]|uniref:TonB-dependent receptor domain-containing protein n=1 Tax=uncultured Sphingomonas sp. TaxID=158754 RepID=UPI0035CAF8C9